MSYKHKKEVQLMHHFYVFDFMSLTFSKTKWFSFFFSLFYIITVC